MKILTIHPAGSGTSRLIPLYVLEKRYINRVKDIQNFFLVPQHFHEELINNNINVLDIDNSVDYDELTEILKDDNNKNLEVKKNIGVKLIRNIYSAVENVKPDLVIEDLEPYAVLPCKEYNIPRISIQRTGQFRSLPIYQRNPNHIHSCEKSNFNDKVCDASIILGCKANEHDIKSNEINFLYEYPESEAKIIPGIPSIEVLPEDIKNKSSYFYCGSLTVEDKPSEKMLERLNAFFDLNKSNKIIFITTGLVDNTSVNEYVNVLFERGYAVITTVNLKINEKYLSKYLYNNILPLNFVCSKADLVIHQCGSGIYNYPIMNNVPSITIGTRCYDREDVAVRLESLGVSKHVPHKLDNSNYLEIFESYLTLFERGELTDLDMLNKLKEENYNTMLNFDIQSVIQYAQKALKNKNYHGEKSN